MQTKSKTFIIFLTTLIIPLDLLGYLTTLNFFVSAFDISIFFAQWMIISPLIGLSIFSAITLRLIQSLDLKKILAASLFIYSTFAFLIPFCPSFFLIIILRFFQGISMAAILVSSLDILTFIPSEKKYLRWIFIPFLGILIAPLYSNFLLSIIHWNWTFYFLSFYSLFLCLIIFCLKFAYVEHEQEDSDYLGFIYFAVIILGLVIAVSGSVFFGWGLSSLILFIVSLLVFISIYLERETKRPLFQFQILRDMRFYASFMSCLSVHFCIFGMLFFFPFYLQIVFHKTLLQTSYSLFFFSVPAFLSLFIFYDPLIKRASKFLIFSMLLLLSMSLLLASFLNTSALLYHIILIVFGLSTGLAFYFLFAGNSLFSKALSIKSIPFFQTFQYVFASLGLSISSIKFISVYRTSIFNQLNNNDIIVETTLVNDLINQLKVPADPTISAIFEASFIQGFQSVSTFLLWISLITLIFGLVFIPVNQQDTIKE